MTPTEYIATAFFFAAALFGIVEAIRTPLVIKRLYRNKGFTDRGKKILSAYSDARIVDGMYTDHVNHDNGSGISQCKSWSTDRRKFTLSKAARKRNRAAWSVTVVEGDFSGLGCLMLPTVVPEAIAYVGNGENIDFEDDLQIANRYHITGDDEAKIKSVVTGDVREFLLQSDVIFIETTSSQLVLKRNWSDHKVLDRLEQELQMANSLHALLST